MEGKEEKPKEINLDIKITVEDDGKPEPVNPKAKRRGNVMLWSFVTAAATGCLWYCLLVNVPSPTAFGAFFMLLLMAVCVVSSVVFLLMAFEVF